MAAPTTIPATITFEAAAHVAELGMQAELDQMLERARQLIPGLQRFEVMLVEPYDTGDEMSVLIDAYRDISSRDPDGQSYDAWRDWRLATFSPDVNRHFTMHIVYGNNHAG